MVFLDDMGYALEYKKGESEKSRIYLPTWAYPDPIVLDSLTGFSISREKSSIEDLQWMYCCTCLPSLS